MKKFVGLRVSERELERIAVLIEAKKYKNISEFLNKAIEYLLAAEDRKDTAKEFLDTPEGIEFVTQLILKIQANDKKR